MMDRMSASAEDIFDIRLPSQPFPGLRPFEKAEWPIFFGREIIVGEVVDQLIEKKFLVLHGDSGSGKSSLVRAGVMPRLERDHARGGATWRTASMLPRNAPLRNLAVALASLVSTPPDPGLVIELRRILNLGTKAALPLAAKLRRDENDFVCLLVDQFEEIFQFAATGGGADVQQFVDVLVGLQQTPAPGLHVILTMRSEFLGSCAHFDGLAETINKTQFLLPRMDSQALLRAIREPARLYGGTVERELAETIIADAGRKQDQLPLMQHAMMLLYHRAVKVPYHKGWTLGIQAYRESGGVAQLLSDHAEAAIEQIKERSPNPKSTARLVELVFKALTDVSADGHAIRRPRSIGELMAVTGAGKDELLAVIEPLCADGVSFLKIFGEKPYREDELVDISHEALIRNWHRLRAWTEDEAEDGAIYRRLLNLAEENRSDSSIIFGLREARDRDRWWKKVTPLQPWADRYSAGHEGITVGEVRGLLDRSLDQQVQEFSFWREQIEIARTIWEKDSRVDALLQGHQLTQAEYWVSVRAGDIKEEDLKFIAESVAERERRKAKDEERESQRRNAEMLAARAEEAVREQQRKNEKLIVRGAIVVAFIVVAAAFVVGIAWQQHKNAREQYKLAENSANLVLKQLDASRERGYLTTKGAEDMLQTAESIFKQVVAAESTLPIRLDISASDAFSDLGDYREAFRRAEGAKDSVGRWLAAHPDDQEALKLRYGSIWRMGDVDSRGAREDQEKALAEYEEAGKIAQRLADLSPRDEANHKEVMFIYQKIADTHLGWADSDRTEFDVAIDLYQRALATIQGVVSRAPGNSTWQRDLANARRKLGVAFRDQRNFGPALTELKRSLEELQELVNKDPTDYVAQSNLAGTHANIAVLYRRRDDPGSPLALDEYRQAIRIEDPRNKIDPLNSTPLFSLATYHQGAGSILKEQGKLTEALDHFEKEQSAREQLAYRDRVNPRRQTSLARADIEFADVAAKVAQAAEGQARDRYLKDATESYERAIYSYRNAIMLFEKMRPSPDSDVFDAYIGIGDGVEKRGNLAGAFGDLAKRRENLADALLEYKRALGIADPLTKASMKDASDWRGRQARALVRIGDVLALQGQTPEAEDQYQRALEVLEPLAAGIRQAGHALRRM